MARRGDACVGVKVRRDAVVEADRRVLAWMPFGVSDTHGFVVELNGRMLILVYITTGGRFHLFFPLAHCSETRAALVLYI